MKSLYFAGGFLVLTGRFVGIGGWSCILSGCVFCCMGWECCVIVLVLSISVGSLLCWDGDVGSSRLVLWAGRLRVNLLSGLNICREEENLVFCFGALFNSTLNFTQSGWHILFSPDLHFRLAKRVSGQTHSLQLETATGAVVSLVAPA